MERTGWCGQEFLDHTTPSARTNEASRLLLIVQPPLLLLRRGVRLEPLPRLGLRANLIRNLDTRPQNYYGMACKSAEAFPPSSMRIGVA